MKWPVCIKTARLEMKLDFCAICGSTADLHQHHIEPVVYSGKKRGKKKKYDSSKSIGDCTSKEIFACLFDMGVISEDEELTVCYYHHSLLHGIMRFERLDHRKLVKEGLERAKKQGKALGRPKITPEKQREVRELRSQGLSYPAVARRTGVSVGKAHGIIKMVEAEEKYLEDKKMSYRNISNKTGVSYGAVQRIVREMEGR